MNTSNTITVQEVRRDPLGFLRQINNGKTLVVIYHSKPFAVVANGETHAAQPAKSTKRLLEYAELARGSAKATLNPQKSYKELYNEDVSAKYGVSGR